MTPSPNFSTSESLVMYTQIFCFIAGSQIKTNRKLPKIKILFSYNFSTNLMSLCLKVSKMYHLLQNCTILFEHTLDMKQMHFISHFLSNAQNKLHLKILGKFIDTEKLIQPPNCTPNDFLLHATNAIDQYCQF